MANAIRSAKSGSDWTRAELIAYNIKIFNIDDFFGINIKDIVPNVDEEISNFNYEKDDIDSLPKNARNLFSYLDLASRAKEGQESMVDDFAREILSYMDYDTIGRIIGTRHSLGFVICGENRKAQTDVCIMRRKEELLLLLQEDKRLENPADPEPQVIAEAIAAFQENNKIRRNNNIAELDEMIIPCITMVGTFPRFYLVPVTMELSTCVMTAQYPSNITTVLCHTPRVPRRVSDGMKPIENRKKILQCFEAFKKFVDDMEKSLM